MWTASAETAHDIKSIPGEIAIFLRNGFVVKLSQAAIGLRQFTELLWL